MRPMSPFALFHLVLWLTMTKRIDGLAGVMMKRRTERRPSARAPCNPSSAAALWLVEEVFSPQARHHMPLAHECDIIIVIVLLVHPVLDVVPSCLFDVIQQLVRVPVGCICLMPQTTPLVRVDPMVVARVHLGQIWFPPACTSCLSRLRGVAIAPSRSDCLRLLDPVPNQTQPCSTQP